MKIKVKDSFVTTIKHVQIQLADRMKWVDLGHLNFAERDDLIKQLQDMIKELRK